MMSATSAFARQGRSFYFASRFLPAEQRLRVAAVYAYCRATDDLVDESIGTAPLDVHAALDDWHVMSRRAYEGMKSGNETIDAAMSDMRNAAIPFRYADELMAGVRMDIEAARYPDFSALDLYTYRVAGVVGLWMTAMFGVREPWMMEHAVCLGRAMQLTNIVRDVGEDLDRGRLYVPSTLLRSYGLSEPELVAMRASGRPITPAYRAVMETMMTTADADYRRAFDAIPYLPPSFSRTVAVAAEVYRGIHGEVRRAGYDTITRRAVTSLRQKCLLAASGLRRAQLAGRANRGAPLAAAP